MRPLLRARETLSLRLARSLQRLTCVLRVWHVGFYRAEGGAEGRGRGRGMKGGRGTGCETCGSPAASTHWFGRILWKPYQAIASTFVSKALVALIAR